MAFEIDSSPEEPRDYTRWIWAGLVVVFALMLALLWYHSGINPSKSMVRVRHILINVDQSDPSGLAKAYERAKDIHGRLLQGEDFSELARKYSQDPHSASRGGDLGWMERGSFVPGFEEHVWTAEIGKLSDPIKTSFGYHLIVVDERAISDFDRAQIEQERRVRERALERTGDQP